jgi:hypothetical protein
MESWPRRKRRGGEGVDPDLDKVDGGRAGKDAQVAAAMTPVDRR